jgi:hypothetical protein
MTVFDDPLASTLPDEQHSDEELRWISVGKSSHQRIVVYTDTNSGIRLIGARAATAAEIRQYEEVS